MTAMTSHADRLLHEINAVAEAVRSEIDTITNELGLLNSANLQDAELLERLLRIREAMIAQQCLISGAAVCSFNLNCYEELAEIGKTLIDNESAA